MENILVTGGAGFIGSHATLELLEHGYQTIIVDNLSNSKIEAVTRVEKLAGRETAFYETDLLDKDELSEIFYRHDIGAVIHFAGYKAVGESVRKPLSYYKNNISGTVTLCEVMHEHDCKTIVFSSSATVYGDPDTVPIQEEFPLSATNPYGRTKLVIENILRDLHTADSSWNVALLRYFNPVGAHESGEIGEDPNDIPNNLMPFITQIAAGKLDRLSVFGDDYPTPDGTGIRDYIHVVDLADGHIKALEMLESDPGVVTYNLGTGRGYSVLEVIKTFEEVTGKEIPYRITGRRPGDIGTCYADPSKAAKELGWKAERDLRDMCRDAWNWQSKYPNGYD